MSDKTAAKTAFADEALAGELHPKARPSIESIRRRWHEDQRVAVTRRTGFELIGVSATRGRELEDVGRIDGYLDNTARMLLVDSLYRYMVEQVLASFPAYGPPAKAKGRPVTHEKRAVRGLPLRVAAASVEPPVKRGRGRPRKTDATAAA
jgi:hypothetical protein